MARKLKTFQTSVGLYDLAVAVPSMKAALEAWGAGSNLFHQGIAKETDDPDVVTATMAKPGVVLKRPAGSSGRFAEHSDLPTDSATNEPTEDTETVDLGPRSERPPRSATRLPAKRQRSSTKSGSGAKPSAGAKKPRWRRSAPGARRRSGTPKRRWTTPSGSTKSARSLSRPNVRQSRSGSSTAIEKRVEAEDARWESEREKLMVTLRRARD